MGKSEQKRVSINALEAYCKVNAYKCVPRTMARGAATIQYEVKRQLCLSESIAFIADVVRECVRPADEMYIALAKPFYLQRCVLQYYGGFAMPRDEEKAYELVSQSKDILEDIMGLIDLEQYRRMESALDDQIAYERARMLSMQEHRAGELLRQVATFMQRMEGLFGGVDGTQLADFVGKVSAAPSLTPEEIAQAVAGSIAH